MRFTDRLTWVFAEHVPPFASSIWKRSTMRWADSNLRRISCANSSPSSCLRMAAPERSDEFAAMMHKEARGCDHIEPVP
ncbi:hypothetical protein CERSUDRAFT_109902 [Gelatoporia subvermispora B]|uniref:Uncharacterized protein n=1 Tax=Ceriporiopsis subvermispora (strain B) TaxID=914234 RepID=M2RS85_CERS8|nr:hypothetical protein CERSUDRAFT_109902 [Gelatoporia subvermispora B]